MLEDRFVAYFSMEIALSPDIPTYSGGLGVLAGDTIRSAADLNVPMVAVSLLHRKGYFYQTIDESGQQKESPVEWAVDDFLSDTGVRVPLTIEGRTVWVRAWRFDVKGITGFVVPVLLLDTNLPENTEQDQALTNFLYGGDQYYRFCQEIILGIGGMKMLRELGCEAIRRFHLNEGHASLLTLDLLEDMLVKRGRALPTVEDINTVRKLCVFTTHTPIPAGHDKFPLEMVYRALGHREVFERKDLLGDGEVLNMTHLGLTLSNYVNGVAKNHSRVSQRMFPNYSIDHVTNGVHAATWVSQPFQKLFDDYIPGWREDNFSLRHALGIRTDKLWHAHQEAKQNLVRYVNREANAGFDMDVLTLGYARRMTGYKRPELLFTNIERLLRLKRPLQILYAGKAHPRDEVGKELIRKIIQLRNSLPAQIKFTFVPNYDFELGKLFTSGVDVWLNTPQAPLEASGTSGMKAALNGVPSLSVLDGWWIEGCIEGVTGWAIGSSRVGEQSSRDDALEAQALYDKLEHVVVPTFYERREEFIDIMHHAISLNGSFFNTHRMIQQYILDAYFC